MWSRTYVQTFTGIDRERVWATWTDVDRWTTWQHDIEYAGIDGPFDSGAVITFKPKGGPRVRIDLTEVHPPTRFVDVTRLPLARMTDVHELRETPEGTEVRNTLTMTGPLAFLWRRLVGEGVAGSLPQQTAALVEASRRG